MNVSWRKRTTINGELQENICSVYRESGNIRLSPNARNNFRLSCARLRQIIGKLHPQPGFSRRSEYFLETDRHLRRHAAAFIDNLVERLAADAKRRCRLSDRPVQAGNLPSRSGPDAGDFSSP